jgi:hypothetical protein
MPRRSGDVVRLSRQLARAEDKLERVLQEIEGLRIEMADPPASEVERSSRSTGPASTYRTESTLSKR